MRIIGQSVDIKVYEFGSVGVRTVGDIGDALKVAGGLQAMAEADASRLNVDRGVPSHETVDMFDIAWLARHAAGLEAD